MLRQFIVRIRQIAVAFVAAAACVGLLSSCGVKGPLKLPPPPASGAGVPAPDAPPAPSAEPAAAPPKPAEPRP